jgi:hypothetical protein
MPLPLESEFQDIVTRSEKIAKAVNKQNAAEYSIILQETRKQVSAVYAKYAGQEGTLSYAEMLKYGRLKTLKQNIDGLVKDSLTAVKDNTNAALKTTISQAYKDAGLAITAGTDIELKPTAELISTILKQPVSGWTVDERMALRTKDLSMRLQGVVTDGFVRKDTLSAANGAIKKALNVDYNKLAS